MKTAAQALLRSRVSKDGKDMFIVLEGVHRITFRGVALNDFGAASFAGALGARQATLTL